MKINPPFVRSAYNYDTKAACEECCVQDYGPSLTVQSQSEDADINTIVKRFGLTGQLPESYKIPQYADFEDVYDFHTAQNAIAEANSSFMAMPPQLRSYFSNDPQNFLEFCSNPDNLPEMRRLGLAKPLSAASDSNGATTTPAANNAVGTTTGGSGVAKQSPPVNLDSTVIT